MNTNYKELFKKDYGIIDEISKNKTRFEAQYNTNAKNILINPFDFELLKIEVENSINIKINSKEDLFAFGLKILVTDNVKIGLIRIN